jgi:hypothetical protein
MRLGWAIWLLNSLLQWVLLVMLLGKNRWRQHKAFAIYIAFCTCKTSLLIWVREGLHKSANSGSVGVSGVGVTGISMCLNGVF